MTPDTTPTPSSLEALNAKGQRLFEAMHSALCGVEGHDLPEAAAYMVKQLRAFQDGCPALASLLVTALMRYQALAFIEAVVQDAGDALPLAWRTLRPYKALLLEFVEEMEAVRSGGDAAPIPEELLS